MFISEEVIGQGACAKVKRVTINDCIYAIKLFKKGRGKREYQIHKILQHPNILSCIVGNEDFIVSELMMCDLFSLVQGGAFSINSANYVLQQLVFGLQYMHSLGYAHRDIKLENILIGNNYEVKLCDFDLVEHESNEQVDRDIGTDGYQAPELMKFGGDIDARILKQCDIFSLGVIYFIMICGKPPIKRANGTCYFWNLIKKHEWNEFWYYALKSVQQEIPLKSKLLFEGMIERIMSLDQILNELGCVNQQEFELEMTRLRPRP